MSGWPSDRRTFVSLGLQCVVNAFVYSTYVARLPDIRDEAGLSIAAMGVVMTVGNLAGFAAMLPSAAVIRRWGSKRVMVVCSVAYVLTLPAIGTSGSPAMLVAAIVAMMVTNALVDVAVAMQSATFSSRRHYPAMSRLSGLYSLGTVGGGVVAAAIVSAGFDVSVHLFVLAVVLAVALVFVSPGLLPADERPPAERRARGGDVPAVDPGRGARPRQRARRAAGRRPRGVGHFPGDRRPRRRPVAVRAGLRRLHRGDDGRSPRRRPRDRPPGPGAPAALGGPRLRGRPGRGRVGARRPDRAGRLPLRRPRHLRRLPLLTEAAARTPGASFTAMFVGNRLAGLLTPLAMGALAGTPLLSVGEAMVILVAPSAALLLLLGVAAVSTQSSAASVSRAPRSYSEASAER